MIRAARRAGFGGYRTLILLSYEVVGTYSWSNSALMSFHESIKNTLDPNNILAPGRVANGRRGTVTRQRSSVRRI